MNGPNSWPAKFRDERIDPKVRALEFRPLRDGDESTCLETFNEVFSELDSSFQRRDAAQWRWLYRQNPAGLRYFVAMASDGRLAAQFPALPSRLVLDGAITGAAQVVDSLVRSEWRKGSHDGPSTFALVGESGTQHCFDSGDVLMFGYPVPRALQMGTRYLEYRVLRVVDYLLRIVGRFDAEGPGEIEVVRGWPADEELDAFERRTRGERRIGLVRDAAWFRWRFGGPTAAVYEPLHVRRDGVFVGFAVLRPGQALGSEGSCAIADWLLADEDDAAFDGLLAGCERFAREQGAPSLLCVQAPWTRHRKMLRERSFGVMPSAWTMERKLTYRIRPDHEAILTEDRLANDWYYTLGDSDLV